MHYSQYGADFSRLVKGKLFIVADSGLNSG